MKTVFLLTMVALLGVSCQKESENLNPQSLESTSVAAQNSFVFGKWLGKCSQTDCAEFYKIEDAQLFPDMSSSYNGFQSIDFSKVALSSEKYLLAKSLQDNFPEYLKQRPNRDFGQPNYYDQGAYSIEMMENGTFKYWQIDTDLAALTPEIRPWVEQLKSVLDQLP